MAGGVAVARRVGQGGVGVVGDGEDASRVVRRADEQLPHRPLLGFSTDERRQYESNRRYWQRWIENVDGDLQREPARILDFYKVSSHRIEPIGLAYLWPVTG